MIRIIALSFFLMNCALPPQNNRAQDSTADQTSFASTTENKTEAKPETKPESQPESQPETSPGPNKTGSEPEPKPEEKDEARENSYQEVTQIYEKLFFGQKVFEECQCQRHWQRVINGVYNQNNVRDKLDLLAEAQAKTFHKDTIKILYVASGMFLQASTIIASILKAGKNVELYLVDPIYLYATNKEGFEKSRTRMDANMAKTYKDANLAYEQFTKILEILSKRYNKTAKIEAITGDIIPKFLPRAASKLSSHLLMNRLFTPIRDPGAEALHKWRSETLKNGKITFDMFFSIDFNGGELELGFYAELVECQNFIYGPHRDPEKFGVFDLNKFKLHK